jgi:hypothetical protein
MNKKLFFSWFFTLITMVSLSYIWHGVILNDLRNVNYPPWYFFMLLVLVYSIVAFVFTIGFNFAQPRNNPLMKGVLGGAAFGFFLYLVAFTLGVSFKSGDTKHVIVDFIWQMMEQGIGGFITAYVFVVAYRLEKAME